MSIFIYWQSGGTRLIPETGEKVFMELTQAADLIQKIKKNETPQVSESLDRATSAILSAFNIVLENTMVDNIDNIKRAYSDLSNSNDISKITNLFSKNEALNLAVQYYKSTLTESDLMKSSQNIDSFRISWLNTIKGIKEISTELGISPTLPQANATTATTSS